MIGHVPVARPIEAVMSHFGHSTTGREKQSPYNGSGHKGVIKGSVNDIVILLADLVRGVRP